MADERSRDRRRDLAQPTGSRPGLPTVMAAAALAALLSGCVTRWQPQTKGDLVTLTRACPGHSGPLVPEIGTKAVRAVYQFVTQDASDAELASFRRKAASEGFNVGQLTLNINGLDTAIALGPAILRKQGEVEAEFCAACLLGSEHIYLTHVRHNPADAQGDYIQVR